MLIMESWLHTTNVSFDLFFVCCAVFDLFHVCCAFLNIFISCMWCFKKCLFCICCAIFDLFDVCCTVFEVQEVISCLVAV